MKRFATIIIKCLTLWVGTCFLAPSVKAEFPFNHQMEGSTKIEFLDVSFAEASQRAKQEGKLIFFDAYTSWCAPCKWMDQHVFTEPSVASYFNAHFINVKFDCEKGEGIELAKRYAIKSFPTYLFLDAAGELIYRTQSRMEAEAFLQHAQQALDPAFQIPELLRLFPTHTRDAAFLLRFIQSVGPVDAKLSEEAKKHLERVADDAFLLSGQSGWDVVHMMARSPQDRYGRFFLSHLSHFYEVANPSEVHEKETQLRRNLVYALIRQGDREGFEREMDYFEKASAKNPSLAVDLAMFSAARTSKSLQKTHQCPPSRCVEK